MVPLAIEVLQNATAVFRSTLSTEALNTAHALVAAAREKMNRSMQNLDHVLGVLGALPVDSDGPRASHDGSADWLTDNELGFTELLDFDNYYEMQT